MVDDRTEEPSLPAATEDDALSPDTLAFCLEHAPDAVFGLDRHGRITFVNQQACTSLGYRREELLALSLNDIDPSYGRDAFQRDWEEYDGMPPRSMTTRRIETEHTRKDGSRLPVEVLVRHVRHGDRHVHVAFVRDISERRKTERDLRLTRTAIDRAATSSFWSRPDGRLFYVNEHACRALGYSREELLEMHVYDVDAEYTPGTWAAFWPVMQAQKAVTFETTHRRKDGTTFPVEVIAHHIRFDDEEFTFGVTRDLTAEKATAAAQAKLEAELTQAQKMESIGRLAGGVAHDFNNMLGVILGYCELLVDDLSEQPEALDALEQIERAALRSRDTARQLLAFSRRQAVEPQVLDLGAQIEAAHKAMRHLVREDVHIEVGRASALWPVKIDPSQVDQILMNLVVNASDAMPEGGTLRIATDNFTFEAGDRPAGAPAGDYVRLTVVDDGVGMAPQVVAQAFEPFFTTKAQGQGTGLGLATVYGIVEQNGGTIRVDSEVGRGTRLTVLLPRVEEPTADGRPTDESVTVDVLTGRRVLVVEDEPMLRRMVAEMLLDLGYSVLAPSSAREALELLRSHDTDVDAVVSDVVMPDMHGPTLQTEVQALRPNLPFVFISGYPSEVTGQAGLLPSDARLLTKPFSKRDLAEEVLRALLGAQRAL